MLISVLTICISESDPVVLPIKYPCVEIAPKYTTLVCKLK